MAFFFHLKPSLNNPQKVEYLKKKSLPHFFIFFICLSSAFGQRYCEMDQNFVMSSSLTLPATELFSILEL